MYDCEREQLRVELEQLERKIETNKGAWMEQVNTDRGKRELIAHLWEYGGPYLELTMRSPAEQIIQALVCARYGRQRAEIEEEIAQLKLA